MSLSRLLRVFVVEVVLSICLYGCSRDGPTTTTVSVPSPPPLSTVSTTTAGFATSTDATTTSSTGTTTSMTSATTTTATKVDMCAPFMSSMDCFGEDLMQLSAISPEFCCDACSKQDRCQAFTHRGSTCYLKTACTTLRKDWDNAAATTSGVLVSGSSVGVGWYEVDGYKCSGQKDTVIFYPMGEGPFNVVVYGHGAWGEIDGADSWMHTIAKQGLIVIVPFTGKTAEPCGSIFADDMLTALHVSKAGGVALHAALGKADWSRTGVFGHSRGAKYAPYAVQKAQGDLNIAAMLLSSDVPEHFIDVAVPVMFTTGTKDKFNTDNKVLKWFDQHKTLPKVYANLEGAYHMEIISGKRLNKPMAQFLACHVAQRQDDCDAIYGNSATSLCHINQYKKCVADAVVLQV